ncbi:MAG: hypothetical protein IMF08_08235 [Proteobacteria bacterium]|nr:hypothetical protein [Pseudomonadota bacterium]
MTASKEDQPELPGIPAAKKKPETAADRIANADEAAFQRVLARIQTLQKLYAGGNQTGNESQAVEKPSRRESATARLFVIRAREAPMAAIIRRGPSKQVRLIAWNTESDTFDGGQWLKGRIYERRCDLSPDGRYFIYFAANHKAPTYSWTAISRLPYLTALAFWPKFDCWEGGGLFEDARNIWLNDELSDAREEMKDLPEGMNLRGKGFGGEDDPIYNLRLLRDGWTMMQPGKYVHVPGAERGPIDYSFPYDPPQIWERANAAGNRLRMVIHGKGEKSGDWNVVSHEIVTPDGEIVDFGRTDWADWDRNGDLLYAKDGKLFRLSPGTRGRFDPDSSREIADFNGDRFQAIPPSEEAKNW